jgi:hypothetical protein
MIEIRRLKALEKWLSINIPYNIKGKYSFDAMGEHCIRVFIYLNENEEATINLLKWLPKLKGKGWKIEKFWRKESGYFSYKANREYRKDHTDYLLLFEKGANLDGCVITKKRKMQTIFVTDCEKETVIL